jgi:glutamine synthetase
MTENTGMLSVEDLRKLTDTNEIETVLVVFSDLYGRFLGKRFDADFFLRQTMAHGTHACDYLLTVDMEMEPVPGYRFANWERGYGDFHLACDLSTLRIASWLTKTPSDLRCDQRARPGVSDSGTTVYSQTPVASVADFRAVTDWERKRYFERIQEMTSP